MTLVDCDTSSDEDDDVLEDEDKQQRPHLPPINRPSESIHHKQLPSSSIEPWTGSSMENTCESVYNKQPSQN
ncbi:hypothetical protein Ddye_031805 [Dipteronia dyeriana]|uniref:Uncharacterized protein n=1 Tax=Dipteronia dyeriana TaxID=168575 RepID=A0AAD9TK16_9ROSI|nr:hypothetical protein Ddye_031805 [Dipteronia dyeriana]